MPVKVVAVLGAGGGGLTTAADLTQAGYRVHLWSRNPATIAPYGGGTVAYTGALGEGRAKLGLVSSDLGQALKRASVVVVCLPAFLHPQVFAELAALRWDAPVVLGTGQVGGALHLREVYRRRGLGCPPVAELSTLPYVCRVQRDGVVSVTGLARRLRCGSLPGHEPAAKLVCELWSCQFDLGDVLASSLANVNLVLHPPAALLAAAWVEATNGSFRFYVDAMTEGVGRVLDALDDERLETAARLGHQLPPLRGEMARVGTLDEEAPTPGTVRGNLAPKGSPVSTASLVRNGRANLSIMAPSSLAHRYYKEDFAFGLAPFLAFADAAGAKAPVARSLLALGRVLVGGEMPPDLDAGALGISGLGAAGLMKLVRG